jgi:hypothetical protein
LAARGARPAAGDAGKSCNHPDENRSPGSRAIAGGSSMITQEAVRLYRALRALPRHGHHNERIRLELALHAALGLQPWHPHISDVTSAEPPAAMAARTPRPGRTCGSCGGSWRRRSRPPTPKNVRGSIDRPGPLTWRSSGEFRHPRRRGREIVLAHRILTGCEVIE